MVSKDIVIGLRDGMEARQVALFVQLAGQFKSHITVVYNGLNVNAKSIMGMMSLGIARGESISIITDGSDEEEAMAGIMEYLSGTVKNPALAI